MPHKNLDDAAQAALWPLQRAPVEQVALLYEQDGQIHNTPPRGDAKDRAREAFQIPKGSLRAITHNHPLSENPRKNVNIRRFSHDDMTMANKLRVPSYISVGNELKRYNPGAMSDHGEPVLAQIPIEEIRKLYLVEALKK